MIVIRLFVAALAAIVVQPLVMFCWFLPTTFLSGEPVRLAAAAGGMSALVMLVAVPFVLVVGVPMSLLLHAFGRLRWWPLALVGGLTGAMLVAWNLPGGPSAYHANGTWFGSSVDFVIDGEVTIYGWIRYLIPVAIMALHGLVGATAFYLAWRRVPDPQIP